MASEQLERSRQNWYILYTLAWTFSIIDHIETVGFIFHPGKVSPSKADNEHSEMLLYQNMVLRDAGRHSEALRHLQKNAKVINDKLAFRQIKGEISLCSYGHQWYDTVLHHAIPTV